MEGRSGPSNRRPAAHLSVSLRHAPGANTPTTTNAHQASTIGAPDGPKSRMSVAPNLDAVNQSSGESSDANQWFENRNENAEQSNANDQFGDNDPPFLLRNESSSETPLEETYPHSMPFRPGFARMNTDTSNGEDFRSVIDDLTVANQKLKKKLKKYERRHDAHLQDEKLFEVRFHGLPDDKKKELAEMLGKFALGLDNSASESHSPAALKSQATKQSMATESGYGTMSGSGHNSTSAPSGGFSGTASGNDKTRPTAFKANFNQQQQAIESYLHDIPAGLLPHPSIQMSASTKKKLVVRRLEQVFAGKLSTSTPGNHQQPMQQEEVAQSAAMADRIALEATGARFQEGHREALIMPLTAEGEDKDAAVHQQVEQSSAPGAALEGQHNEGDISPDQRPTRPMDLDLARAQVPADNMEYMRHLGFALPKAFESPQDGQGWIYLNVLINMAQLHTINVTPDFVKDALAEYSSMFELSHDGRKVRWRGGQDLTLNSDSSSDPNGNSADDLAGGPSSKSTSKHLESDYKRDSSGSLGPEKQTRRARSLKEKELNKLAYVPLFFRRQDSEEDDDMYNSLSSSGNSPPLAHQRGDSSAFASSGFRSESSRKKRDDGPMIFYNKANFCTDLSGDHEGLSPAAAATSYQCITSRPLGSNPSPPHASEFPSGITEPKGPLNSRQMDLDVKAAEGLSTSSEDDFALSLPDLRSDSSARSPSSVEFPASGIGGVLPDDNFAIRVRRQQVRGQPSAVARIKARKSRLYSKKILDALDENPEAQPVIKEQILSTSRKSLPSSELPPASYLPFDSTSSGDVDSDLDSDVSSSPSISASSTGPAAMATPQVHYFSPTHQTTYSMNDETVSSSSGEVSEGSDNSHNSHSANRRSDHSDANRSLSDRGNLTDLFEEIQAGSSAATAGGGSGFNSPADFGHGEIDMRGWQKPNTRHPGSGPTSPANLKRARTSDSIAAVLDEPAKSQKLN